MAIFKKSSSKSNTVKLKPWKVAIIDDEADVHEVTKLTLRKFTFENRGLEFLSAYSAKEGIALFEEHRDIALAFVDVVMETDDAGLRLIDEVRNTQKNYSTRLILRTDSPGRHLKRMS